MLKVTEIAFRRHAATGRWVEYESGAARRSPGCQGAMVSDPDATAFAFTRRKTK